MLTMLLELVERRYGESSTVLFTQYQQRDWHASASAPALTPTRSWTASPPNTVWVETDTYNMREQIAIATA